jgi:hypothetical protein
VTTAPPPPDGHRPRRLALERDRFVLGDSTQFMVNLRELATADAALREVRAVTDRHKARVAVDAATGALLSRGQP